MIGTSYILFSLNPCFWQTYPALISAVVDRVWNVSDAEPDRPGHPKVHSRQKCAIDTTRPAFDAPPRWALRGRVLPKTKDCFSGYTPPPPIPETSRLAARSRGTRLDLPSRIGPPSLAIGPGATFPVISQGQQTARPQATQSGTETGQILTRHNNDTAKRRRHTATHVFLPIVIQSCKIILVIRGKCLYR